MNRKLYMLSDVPSADLKAGDVVYEYHEGFAATGISVSREKDQPPFMEVPFSSVSYFSDAERASRRES